MIARLIESGQMQWTDTVGEVFAKASVHEDWKPVTLRQLLTDAAGAPPNLPKELWHKRPARGLKRVQARHDAVLEVIAAHPAYPPGAKYVYSNVGYTIAAAMAESVTGLAWEDLVEREVFEPLALSGAGFGPPQSTNETRQQPRGHFSAGSSKVAMDDTVDNTPIIAPAAAIHMTLEDLCRFADEHMLGELGRGQLLSAESYRLLHTPQLNHYACGWIRQAPGKAIPCTMYWHNGSNKMWYALAVFIPETNTVVAVASNDGDFQNAERAAWEIVMASAKQNRVLAERPLDEE
ncbi:MAG: beta-lactamase family protein [Pirellulales bacterium]|nr:beta-lactamase family protein [Pirellulales bacterium]